MNVAFSPFYDSEPNKVEEEYLRILEHHHSLFVSFAIRNIKESNLNSAVEIGSYLTNVAVELRPHLKKYMATEVDTGNTRDEYKKWASKNGLDVGINHIDSDGINIYSQDGSSVGLYDLFLASEIFEHLHYNPVDVFESIKKYITPNGLVVVSVPNRFSLSKILNFFSNKHPYIKFNDFISSDKVLRNYGIHWLEYNLHDLDFIFKNAGFRRVNYETRNIKYSSKFNYLIKNIVKVFSFGLIFDQIYSSYIQDHE